MTQLLNTDTDKYCHTGGHVHTYTSAHGIFNTGVDSGEYPLTDLA